MSEPQLGDYLVTSTNALVPWIIRKVCRSPVNHAAVYVGNGLIVEAQPSGAQLNHAKVYPNAIWSHNPALALHVRLAIVNAAMQLVGTPYNFVDIAAQLLVRLFHWHAPNWALRRLSKPTRLQCAQLVDEAYQRAGVQLFKDGRPDGLVAPSDLYDLIMESQHG